MKLVSPGRRALRWLLVLLFIGGGVFAAESNWLASLGINERSLTNWLARFSGDAPAEETVVPAEPIIAVDTSYANNTWLNTALFSPAASGWTLDSAKAIDGPMIKTQQVSTTIVPSSLPTAEFSSGFISYSPGIFGPEPHAPTASGTWSATASGNWSNAANWSAGLIADGAGNTANFNAVNITNDVTVTLDSSRTIGSLNIGDTNGTHHYTLNASGGSTLTFDNVSNTATLNQVSASAGDTIAVPIIVASSLDVTNASSNVLTINGGISGSSGFPGVSFTGKITVNGNISDGGATHLQVSVNGGTVILTGTNTYTGGTFVSDGILLINDNNSGATSSVQVFGSGTLGGTGTVAGNVLTYGATITGGDATSVGTLTLTNNLLLNTGEGSGTYLANISGATSDLLAITGTLTLGGESSLVVSGALDGVTTYTIATFSDLVNDMHFFQTSGIPSNYSLIYHDMDIQLVPIPEPATWIGGTLALGAIGFVALRKRRRPARA